MKLRFLLEIIRGAAGTAFTERNRNMTSVMTDNTEMFCQMKTVTAPEEPAGWRVELIVTPPENNGDGKALPEEVRETLKAVQGCRWVEDLPTIQEVQWAYIQAVLLSHGGNKTATAKALGVDRRTLHRKLDKGLTAL